MDNNSIAIEELDQDNIQTPTDFSQNIESITQPSLENISSEIFSKILIFQKSSLNAVYLIIISKLQILTKL